MEVAISTSHGALVVMVRRNTSPRACVHPIPTTEADGQARRVTQVQPVPEARAALSHAPGLHVLHPLGVQDFWHWES